MLALNVLCSALLALVSVTSAAPAPASASAPSPDNRYEGMTAVEFKGKTLYVNTTALAKAPSSPADKRSTLSRRSNICGTSTIEPAPSGPYSQVSDCWVIRDYVNSHDHSFWIQNEINGYVKLIDFQTCMFKAQTYNWFQTYIGSGDVSDLIRDSINQLQYNGVVGARGQMGCPHFNGISATRWAIVTE